MINMKQGAAPFFSVIIPVHVWNDYRKNSLKRAIKSVKDQTFKDYELIVVNDGSTIEFKVPSWVRVVTQPNLERVRALDNGIKNAKGQWICLLDSDDTYEPHYLETFRDLIDQFPQYKIFNCGSLFHYADGNITQRDAFKPGVKEEEPGHVTFSGGNIVNGTFIWHRSVTEDLGAFPGDQDNVDCTDINYGGVRKLSMSTPYDFSAYAQIEFPEIRQFFMVNHENEPNKIIKELGNPWGNDFYLFYKYTRKYRSYPFDEPLLNVYIKKGVE